MPRIERLKLEDGHPLEAIETIKPKLEEDHQILAALASTGAGFEALGGSTLMLTEPVENSVDSIIEANKHGIKVKGIIRIFIDRSAKQVVVIDNGLGFVNPRHICEKPFDSLKRFDPDLTGKFARGLQGFRSYCNKLTFITRRIEIPPGESFAGVAGKTIRLDFSADKVEVSASVEKDVEFLAWTWDDFGHGAVAIYHDWKAGEFDKVRKDKLVRRIERHFGELIRKGEVEILVWEGDSTQIKKKIPKHNFYACQPRDYNSFTKVNIPEVTFNTAGGATGKVVFDLYLTTHAKRERDSLPFLMYKDRPVGDAPISEIAEFADTDVWSSSYLTGFIRCDFCEINELRLALKPGPSRDFLFHQLEAAEPTLRDAIKKHHRGLIDIKRSQEINQIVNQLQSFLREKKIFDFKLAKELGLLATDEKPQTLETSKTAGSSESTPMLASQGENIVAGLPIDVVSQKTVPGQETDVFVPQNTMGGTGDSTDSTLQGGPGELGAPSDEGKNGYKTDSKELKKLQPQQIKIAPGEASVISGKLKRRRPRGFNISLQEDEYSDELSSFDPVNSTVIINSGHKRYVSRDDPNSSTSPDLMVYISELYIWEICRLASKTNPEMNLPDTFLKTKFEFFEGKP